MHDNLVHYKVSKITLMALSKIAYFLPLLLLYQVRREKRAHRVTLVSQVYLVAQD